MHKFLDNLDKDSILATNPHEKRTISSNQQSLAREYFPSKLRNDFSHFVTERHEFFTNHVMEYWNKLPNSVARAPSLNIFKARLDFFYDSS